jgi:acetoin utilization deacetylase AcuC-like enzyme
MNQPVNDAHPPRVGLHLDDAHLAHDVPGHPEQPDRIAAIRAGLDAHGLSTRMASVDPRTATDAELQLVHHPDLVQLLRRLDAAGGAQIDPDTAVLNGSVEAATRAVGGVLNAVDDVLGGALDAAFCADRPPGHHATPVRAMGFCLFNQVAIAARYAQTRHQVERVAIIDIDVHHGNGTQDAFEQDTSVLYCSTHEYPFYPGTGHWRDQGAGTIVNLSLPAGSGDPEYAASFERVIAPAVRRFRPQLILVSAGFDAHLADPLADMAVTEAGYRFMAGQIASLAHELCEGRMVWALEGGYRLEALSRSVATVLALLLGDMDGGVIDGPLRPDVARLLGAARDLHGLSHQ